MWNSEKLCWEEPVSPADKYKIEQEAIKKYEEDQKKYREIMEKAKKDFDDNPITKYPPFTTEEQLKEDPTFDVGFIPTLEQLTEAMLQLPNTFYHNGDMFIVQGLTERNNLQFTKINGQWHYFGPVKYK